MITQARHSGSRYIAADADDPTAYGPDGLLKDGYKIRVPVTMMDSVLPVQRIGVVPAQRSAPQVIGNNADVRREMRKHFHADGSPKTSREVRDREREREQKAADVANAAVAFDAQYGGSHRPGFRFADTAGGTTNDARVDAYNAYCSDLQNQWKTPERKVQDAADQAGRVTADAARPQDVSETDWARAQMIAGNDALAYHQKHVRDNRFWQQPIEPPKTDDASVAREQRDRETSDAWRVKDAPAVPNRPASAWGQAGLAAKAGDPCMTNAGEAGVLREEGGWLYCDASYLGATRSGERSAGDVPVTRASADAMSLADGERLKQEAWEAMANDVSSAWKRQG